MDCKAMATLMASNLKLLSDASSEAIDDTKRKLAAKFKMKDLGMMHYFLGMEVWQNANGISLVQGKYAVEIRDDGLQGHDHTYGIEP